MVHQLCLYVVAVLATLISFKSLVIASSSLFMPIGSSGVLCVHIRTRTYVRTYVCLYVWQNGLVSITLSWALSINHTEPYTSHLRTISHGNTYFVHQHGGNMYVYLMCVPLPTIHYNCSWYSHNMSNVYTSYYYTANSSQVVSVNVIM